MITLAVVSFSFVGRPIVVDSGILGNPGRF
jgi:hypothetical protein